MKKHILLVSMSLMMSANLIFAQSPGGVSASSTNKIWLDAFQTTATNGQQVQTWSDFSGNGINATQSLGARRPIFKTNSINGMPALDFDGTDDYLQIAANPAALDGNKSTHFVVYDRSNLISASTNMIFNLGFVQATNLIFTYAYPSTNQSYIVKSGGGVTRVNSGGAVNNNIVSSFLWNGSLGTYKGYYNGTATAQVNNAFNSATGHKLGRIGAFNTNYKFRGKIAEVIYYTSVLNSAERNIVENYLAAKYQIPVSNSLYSHELTNRYDVIGIGQEADGNNLSASGTTNLTLSATTMNNGDYVLAGHDNGGFGNNTTDVPAGYSRYNQVWRSTLTNYTGTVDISFDVSTIGLGNDNSYILMVDDDGIFATDAAEYLGVFAAGTVTFTGVTLTDTSYFTLANNDFSIVSTGVTNDWHLTTTWNCGCVPTLGSDVNILAGHNVFINGQNAQVNNLIIDGSLTFNSSDSLILSGDLTNNNIITPGVGTFMFAGVSLAQNITGAVEMYNLIVDNTFGVTVNTNLGVQGWLDVVKGSITTNNSLTLRSNASGTAAFYSPDAGDIIGNYTIERFLDEGESYYLLAPVVSGGDLEDWNQEFEMQGFTGTEWIGGVSSVYYFDQNNIVDNYNQGYSIPNSTFYIIDPKTGYEIYVGNDTKATGARTIDITGGAVLGNVSYNLLHLVKTGNTADDGWSLVTNPYPAPIKWWTVSKSANFDAAYVKRANGYRQSINNQWVLGSGEAFFVHSNLGGSTMTFKPWAAGYEKDITDTYNYKNSNQQEEVLAVIKLENNYNNNLEYDIAYIGFNKDATDNRDIGIDALKLNNSYTDKPNLSTINNDLMLERNILSEDANQIIPLQIVTEYPSGTLKNYKLIFEEIENLLANNKKIVLEDRDLGVFTQLTQDTSYSFSMMDTVTQARFFLHVTSPLQLIKNDITCYGANNGKLIANGFSNASKNYVWKDEANNVVATSLNVNGADSALNLVPGIYTVEVTNNVTLETATNTFEIEEPLEITTNFYTLFDYQEEANIVSTDILDTILVYTNQIVFFQNNSENSIAYSWNFGDLISSSLENPTHTYNSSGIYKVELTASNGGCAQSVEQYVNVVNPTSIIETNLLSGINVYNTNNEVIISFVNEVATNYEITIYNNLGQEVVNKNIMANNNHKESIHLDNVANGVYLVSVKNNEATKTKKIVISNK